MAASQNPSKRQQADLAKARDVLTAAGITPAQVDEVGRLYAAGHVELEHRDYVGEARFYRSLMHFVEGVRAKAKARRIEMQPQLGFMGCPGRVEALRCAILKSLRAELEKVQKKAKGRPAGGMHLVLLRA